jgi:oxepin-CoA hydrolase/3-oxo-5,6-dehydrosuberyl-CoA semialdehyde dehydrogenase
MLTIPFDISDAKLRQTFMTEILPDCITNLEEDARPQWGKMTAQHMVEHLIWTFELSTGKFDVPFDIPTKQLRATKLFLYNNRATPRDFKNPMLGEEPPALLYANLDEAKTGFLEVLTRFLNHFRAQPGIIHTHPLFGPTGAEDWERIHFKHCYHHLLQFGLIEEPEFKQ